jgi:aryl-phospho-beta-D-glucosidase BglC (GH1 family)
MGALLVALTCLLLLPLAASAQLPTPTHGWNLGNTLEPPGGEGTWGPPATQNLINAVADAGYDTIRIPCAWDSHANPTTHQIDPVWMARVKQVVDWCYSRNLHVVLNCHWDNGWLENHITGSVDATINAKMNSYWTQIANVFKPYDSKLLFAGANEPNVKTAAQMSTLSVYYQTFVDAVRATGGNNRSRWLVVQGPSTDIALTDQLMNVLPNDPTPGRLAVEVHYYAPYQWCLMTADASWGKMFYFWGQAYHSTTMPSRNATLGEEASLDAEFQKMKSKFIDHGIPVLLGEFQAMKRTGYSDLTGSDFNRHVASRTYFHKYAVDSANRKGLKPIYWDIAGQQFDWTTGALLDPDNKRALTGGAALPPPGLPADVAPAIAAQPAVHADPDKRR